MEKNRKTESDQVSDFPVKSTEFTLGMRLATKLLLYTVGLVVMAVVTLGIFAFAFGTSVLTQLGVSTDVMAD
ncbi:MAG: hypothetical protein AB7V37_10770, partial [Eubacteriaceae bacterium]